MTEKEVLLTNALKELIVLLDEVADAQLHELGDDGRKSLNDAKILLDGTASTL